MNQFWVLYKELEKEIISLSYNIHITDEEIEIKGTNYRHNQFNVYSNKTADLLILCSIQIEALYLHLYKNEMCSDKDPESIGTMAKHLKKLWNLEKKQVIINSLNMTITKDTNKNFAPFDYGENDIYNFYKIYNAVKHNRDNCLYKASVHILLRAMAALYILNLYEKDKIYFFENHKDFDPSQDSSIFSCLTTEPCNIDEASKCLYLIYERESYFDEVEKYVDSISSNGYELKEIARLSDKIKEPIPRFKFILNKEAAPND